jgi:nucleoside-diphosphate-sugar epimerase
MKIMITGGSGFIGTNLIDAIVCENYEILNLDIKPPNRPAFNSSWKECNILDLKKFRTITEQFSPDVIIHLAARTDTDSDKVEDYSENTAGTRNLIEIIKGNHSVRRVIFTSTQFVNQYHGKPKDDFDFAPHTAYGESKVINEKDIRKADLKPAWTIIRPTNIWGPWHKRYPFEFWKVLSKGKYFHPGKAKVMRSYGYVGNIVWQIEQMIKAERSVVDKKVFYVGDPPLDLLDWVNAFSLAQTGKKVTIIPRVLVKTLAVTGECLKVIGIKFPITLSRYRSMTTSNDAPMQSVIDTFGTPPYSLQMGVDKTVEWMKQYHPELIK